MNVKRSMKGAAVEAARISASAGAGFLSKRVLANMRIEYDPPSSGEPLYPGGRRAAACISIDFDVTVDDRFGPNRAGTTALVDLSEEYGVPLTWAICGKTAEADPQSYQRLTRSSTRKELGVHTYSHIDAQKCSSEEFEEDIVRCLRVMDLGSAPPTFIFPWNRENHFPVLSKLGFRDYRGKARVVGPPVPNADGLYNVRPVYYVDQKSHGAESLITRYIDLCVSTSTVFHLWTHPWSIVRREESQPMLSTLKPVFGRLKELSDSGDLALCTMGELSDHFRASRTVAGG